MTRALLRLGFDVAIAALDLALVVAAARSERRWQRERDRAAWAAELAELDHDDPGVDVDGEL